MVCINFNFVFKEEIAISYLVIEPKRNLFPIANAPFKILFGIVEAFKNSFPNKRITRLNLAIQNVIAFKVLIFKDFRPARRVVLEELTSCFRQLSDINPRALDIHTSLSFGPGNFLSFDKMHLFIMIYITSNKGSIDFI